MRSTFTSFIQQRHEGVVLEFELSNEMPESFYEWWPRFWPMASEVVLSGAEPLNCEALFEVFDYFGDIGDSGDLRLRVQTPLSAPLEVVERLVAKSHYIRNLYLTLKDEGGDAQEWIRKAQIIMSFAKAREIICDSSKAFGSPSPVADWFNAKSSEFRSDFLKWVGPHEASKDFR